MFSQKNWTSRSSSLPCFPTGNSEVVLDPIFWSKSELLSIPMKFSFLLVFPMTVAAAFADDAIKIVSPDNTTTLVVDKSGKRDLIALHSGKIRHRLFYEDLDTLFRAKLDTIAPVLSRSARWSPWRLPE